MEGDQISFARIRIRVDVPTAGTYVITHPYGVEVFTVDYPRAAGDQHDPRHRHRRTENL